MTLADYIDTSLAAKSPSASPTFTGTVALPSSTTLNGVTLANAGLTLISQQTVSAAGSAVFNSVFSAAYRMYMLTFSGYGSTDGSGGVGVRIQMRLSGSNAVTNYVNNIVYSTSAAGPTRVYQSAQASLLLGWALNYGGTINCTIGDPALALNTQFLSLTNGSGSNTSYAGNQYGLHGTGTAYDGCSVAPDSGTLTGQFAIYGLRAS